MAIDLKPILTSDKFSAGDYDPTTGTVTLGLPPGLSNAENVIKEGILGLIESAQGQRTNLDFPISEPSFSSGANQALVTRSNEDNTNSELQVEVTIGVVYWLKAPDLSNADAVNSDD